ncbi:copper homeostasis protein CutC [Vibrio sp. MA40-2]|uniref:copper homeostasis protein CutC n=1 Tax=Vibrio sp. MA40-2 TaxID=3391828 RepID=UPI0039A48BC3
MNKISIEVCVDNIESLDNAIKAGADRIELCSALLLGGLTPTYGLTSIAVNSHTPIYAMIRPRSGDFLYSNREIDMMCDEIQFFKEIGINGIVIGALTSDAQIDTRAVTKFVNTADNMGVTFHRAFDLVQDPFKSLETLIDLGCERVLTSGGADTAVNGIECIKALVQQSAHRITVMPGCGINNDNAMLIINDTDATELHLSGKKSKTSKMVSFSNASMGTNSINDNFIDVTDFQLIKKIVTQFNER